MHKQANLNKTNDVEQSLHSNSNSPIPEWNFADMEDRACPVCGERKREKTICRVDGVKINLCCKCCVFYVSPSPSNSQIMNLYKDYYSQCKGQIEDEKTIFDWCQNMNPFDDVRIRELISYVNPDKKKILDVGFGKAIFLFLMKKLGAITFGVDVDEKVIKYAKVFGIKHTYLGSLASVTESEFDIITLNDLIEHPLRPMEVFEQAVSLLKSKGYLVIWTPNGDLVLEGTSSHILEVDFEHMQYFTTNTCSYLSQRFGLRIVHLETIGFPTASEKVNKKYSSLKKNIRKVLKSLPGSYYLSVLKGFLVRNLKSSKQKDDRMGCYNLFCIFQKTT